MSDADRLVTSTGAAGLPPSYSASTAIPQPQGAPPPYTPSVDAPPYPPAGDGASGASGYQYQSFDKVVTSQVDVVHVTRLGANPCLVQCPSCGQFGMTCVAYKPGALTIIAAIICFFFCIICTFLPFCMRDLQDVSHFCPSCGYHIGTYSRI